MSAARATPRPWRAEGRGIGMHIVFAGDPDPVRNRPAVCACMADGSDEEKEANAALIVRCVNAHDDLVAALTEMEKYVVDILTGPIMSAAGIRWPEGGPNGPVLQRARAALAKAGEP